MLNFIGRDEHLKHIYETNEKIKRYVDHYAKTYGGHHKGITIEEALSHKLVIETIEYLLSHKDEDTIGQYPDMHNYN